MRRTPSFAVTLTAATFVAIVLVAAGFLTRPLWRPMEKELQARGSAALRAAPSAAPQAPVSRLPLEHRIFRGIDLRTVPRSTDPARLPDLFEARPPGSQSFHVRDDVEAVGRDLHGTVYNLPNKQQFYIQSDPLGSSTMTFFGPIAGDPRDQLTPAND